MERHNNSYTSKKKAKNYFAPSLLQAIPKQFNKVFNIDDKEFCEQNNQLEHF